MTYQELFKKYTNQLNKDQERTAIELIVLEVNGLSKQGLILNYNNQVLHLKKTETLISEYFQGMPVQYLLGFTYFYGYKFFVSPAVLIPRFDSEILIEAVLEHLDKGQEYRILDIGTGSGNLAITLKKLLPKAIIEAVDISDSALELAKKNAKYHKVDINFIQSDLFSNVNNKYDIIISNPPYIRKEDLLSEYVLKEPKGALIAEEDGLYYYKTILKEINRYLNDKYLVFFEIGINQETKVTEYVRKYLGAKTKVYLDLNLIPRVVMTEGDKSENNI